MDGAGVSPAKAGKAQRGKAATKNELAARERSAASRDQMAMNHGLNGQGVDLDSRILIRGIREIHGENPAIL